MYLKDSFIGFEILQYLQQEGLICSFSLLLLLSIVWANCLSFVSSNVLPGVTFVEVYVFPGPSEPQAKLRGMGNWSFSWAPGEAFSHCLPAPDFSQTSSEATKISPHPTPPFFFFLTTSKVLSPWFSERYPFLNFTLNHSGGKGITEVRKYGKNVNNLPLKYTLRIFSVSIISTLNF